MCFKRGHNVTHICGHYRIGIDDTLREATGCGRCGQHTHGISWTSSSDPDPCAECIANRSWVSNHGRWFNRSWMHSMLRDATYDFDQHRTPRPRPGDGSDGGSGATGNEGSGNVDGASGASGNTAGEVAGSSGSASNGVRGHTRSMSAN